MANNQPRRFDPGRKDPLTNDELEDAAPLPFWCLRNNTDKTGEKGVPNEDTSSRTTSSFEESGDETS